MKLGLGTVQFGQAYGISNTQGQVSRAVAAAILAQAAQAGVRVLDTASLYGEAEDVLAALDTKSFRIITKTISAKNGVAGVVARARQSAKKMNADTLLVHAAADLDNADLWPALQALKVEGVFRRIGISTYAADDSVELATRFRPDVIQLPCSILDQRLLINGTMSKLKELGVEIHARSIFLQGLLFLDTLPKKLRSAAPRLAQIKKAIADGGSTSMEAALSFVLSRPEIDVALVGVTSPAELQGILAATRKPLPVLDWAALALDDEVVLTPSLW